MFWRTNHENTDSIQDALTWTCENQDHMATTYHRRVGKTRRCADSELTTVHLEMIRRGCGTQATLNVDDLSQNGYGVVVVVCVWGGEGRAGEGRERSGDQQKAGPRKCPAGLDR